MLAALISGSGWLIALLAREPVLLVINKMDFYTKIFLSSLMAGLFEETARYVLLRYPMPRGGGLMYAVSAGLGWGLTEALLIYAMQVPLIASIYEYSWTVFLPGAVERNASILFHIGMAMLLALGVMGYVSWKKALPLAISLHTALNVTALIFALILKNPWLIEGVIAVLVLVMVMPIMHYYRKIVGKQESTQGLKLKKTLLNNNKP